jgi:hypothetical protein
LKIFLTKFVHDGRDYCGPDIHADTLEEAELIAEYSGLWVEGELTDLVGIDIESRPRVLH